MNDDIKGLCLFVGLLGLTYVACLLLLTLLTGAKIVKGFMFMLAFSCGLISLGLTPQVKTRMANIVNSYIRR